jgi:peptidoglycan/xylan/chitin deacetylase (PgdA/CDA1 family)
LLLLAASPALPLGGAAPVPPPRPAIIRRGAIAAGVLPEAEKPIFRALVAGAAGARVVRIEAATNGRRTLASVVYLADDATLDPAGVRAALRDHGWAFARAAFDAAPTVDEVHLTGLGPRDFPRTGNPTNFTFSAAVSRAEFDAARRFDGRGNMAAVTRVWEPPAVAATAAGAVSMPTPLPGSAASRAGRVDRRPSGVAHAADAVEPRAVYRGEPGRRVAALTIDDGPLPLYASLLLDTLRDLDVRATFFLLGQRAERYPFFTQAIVAAGHEIGNHSYSHPDLARERPDVVYRQIAVTQHILARATGREPAFFRPPAGRFHTGVLRTAQALGLRTVMWSNYPRDTGRPAPALIVGHVKAGVADGSIVLLHQGVAETIAALPGVVDAIRRRGLAVATVGETLR